LGQSGWSSAFLSARVLYSINAGEGDFYANLGKFFRNLAQFAVGYKNLCCINAREGGFYANLENFFDRVFWI
jgi:hypothetical protein